MLKGIDVSKFQGTINWEEVKSSGVQFAIIRAGYGNSISQKDICFDANMEGALSAGIPVGAYWFSYAISVEDAKAEAAVFLQVLSPYRDSITFPAAFDYEYASREYASENGVNATPELINQMATAFLNAVKSGGYRPMLYTNNDYRINIFSAETLAAWDIWLADYNGDPDISCAIQQTASNGSVSGISVDVDTDKSFVDYSSLSDTTVHAYYRVRAGDVWLPEVCDLTDFAGCSNGTTPISDIALRVSAGSVNYRVHVNGGSWLPYVTGCNISDSSNGYAGMGTPIDAVEINYNTPDSIRPYKKAKYRVAPCGGSYYAWQLDGETTNGQDGYAGSFGNKIAKLQVCIE